MKADIFSQSPYRCKLDWGTAGARRAAARRDIIVIVDVLSFSTSVALAVSRGGIIYPCGEDEDTHVLAAELHADLAVKREQVPAKGCFSLSPMTYAGIAAGTRVLLPSLNGGLCTDFTKSAAHVFAGGLVNASPVGRAVTDIVKGSGLAVTVIACGEREKAPPHGLRPAIEDYLGAGAILAHLPFEKSPEARVCEAAFVANKNRLNNLIWESVSGRELRAEGFEDDVRFASAIDTINTVPVLTNRAFANFHGSQT